MHFLHHFRILLIITLFVKASTSFSQTDSSFVMTPIGPNNFLEKPWDLHYGPDNYLWVSERVSGKLLRVNPETAEIDELIRIPDVYSDAGQDGLLGFALHSDFMGNNPYVYLSYTYISEGERRQRLARYTYQINGNDGSLSSPVTILENLPSSNDHNSGRLVYGPDGKLYYSIGDQGSNRWDNKCNPILSQVLPTQEEINRSDWSNYPGKILRINTDGSIPSDNPALNLVRSHIFTYGHRNPQGLVFGSNGILYSDEHGPKTDDEVNIIAASANYGWPNVAGYKDDQAYFYCNWSSASNCESLSYSDDDCPPSASISFERNFSASYFVEPMLSMFAVPDDYDFNDPNCDNSWICRPNVAPSSIGIYEADAIESWKNSLLVTSLKRGRVYRLKLDDSGYDLIGDTTEIFYTKNRYRDIVVDPNGEAFYIITDDSGRTSGLSGLTVADGLDHPGNILKFTWQKPSSTEDPKIEPAFEVWPNPVSDKVFVQLNGLRKGDYNAELVNLTGQIVKDFGKLEFDKNEMEVGELSPGVYVLRIYSQEQSLREQVIIH